MSCYSCTEKFGIFRKEHSCRKCQLSFCSKCLPQKAVVPNKGSKAHPVCRSCYKILNNPPDPDKDNKMNQRRLSPPENFKRRMEVLAAKTPKDQEHSNPMNNIKEGRAQSQAARNVALKGLEPKDKAIVDRLNKLKEGRVTQQGTIPTTQNMEERLRALKGLPPASSAQSSTSQATKPYFTPDNRNFQEQFNDLVDEMSSEISLEGGLGKQDDEPGIPNDIRSGTQPADDDKNFEENVKRLMKESEEELKRTKEQDESDAEMAGRLASLQGLDPEKAKSNFKNKRMSYDASSDEDEETATKRLLQQLAEEEKLDKKLRESGNDGIVRHPDEPKETKEEAFTADPDELPWCCICNEDAILRCLSCDGDLFCKRCFKEGHDKSDEHMIKKYKAPTNKHV